DFTGLPARYAFIAMMPQWEFLDFIAEHATRLPAFTLCMRAEATGLIEEGGRVLGVRGRAEDREFAVRADCTIACDGRHSTLRAAAGLPVADLGAPIDVLWFRVARDPAETDSSLARIAPGRFVVTIDRGDYWQCAFVIAKGGADALRQRPLAEFRAQVMEAAPILAAHIVEDVRSWDDVKLLTVTVDRLTRWSLPGLLCIGDAAHAMSPIGGVGINLAVQDAVATANLLAGKLRGGTITGADLEAVKRRRLWPTRATQAAQLAIQDNVLVPVMSGGDATLAVPLPMRVVTELPVLQRALARLLGMGVRPEHVRSQKLA
ncbi:MAG: FAD-dependent oxidoreductase, partial [Rhizobacter sp.]|nr:FAD-dependent oxidoreductase [Rhizobacter sp.]